jgi:hypothetical protein
VDERVTARLRQRAVPSVGVVVEEDRNAQRLRRPTRVAAGGITRKGTGGRRQGDERHHIDDA